MNDVATYPLFLHRLAQFAELANDPDFRILIEGVLHSAPWVPHQLLSFVHQYFQILTVVATTPANVRNLAMETDEEKFPLKNYKASEYLFTSLIDQLRQCIACNNFGILAHPPSSCFLFNPNFKYSRPGDSNLIKQPNAKPPNARNQHCQLIYSGQGKLQVPLSKLSVNPCVHFLEGKCTNDNCKYAHLLFPRDFTNKADRIVLDKWVEDTADVKWSNTTKTHIDTMKASSRF